MRPDPRVRRNLDGRRAGTGSEDTRLPPRLTLSLRCDGDGDGDERIVPFTLSLLFCSYAGNSRILGRDRVNGKKDLNSDLFASCPARNCFKTTGDLLV